MLLYRENSETSFEAELILITLVCRRLDYATKAVSSLAREAFDPDLDTNRQERHTPCPPCSGPTLDLVSRNASLLAVIDLVRLYRQTN